jgi:predicted nucleic acid-binding protein
MTGTVRWLADTSALVRLGSQAVAEVLASRIRAGAVATCGVIELELLSDIPDQAQVSEIRAIRSLVFPWLDTGDEDWQRALAVQALLVEAGHHQVAWPRLIVAAVAERHGVPVLHYEPVFAVIAEITGQGVEWVAPEGSLG